MSKKRKSRYSLTYLASQAFKSLFRNSMMTVASVAVLMACLTVMGSFAILVHHINYNMEQLGLLNEIVVFCDTSLNEDEVKEVGRQIRNIENVDADSLELISKAQVLEEEKQKYSEGDNAQLFNDLLTSGQNPYPDTYVIKYEDNSEVSTIEMELGKIDGIEKIKCRADLAQKIESLKHGVIVVFTLFLAVLFVVSVFVIINTIKLAVFSRRQEISIMRYVGATKAFITTPFVLEGVIIGVVSSVVAFFAEFLLYRMVYNIVGGGYSMIKMIPFAEFQWLLLGAFAAIGVVTGIIGSSISLNKYMKA